MPHTSPCPEARVRAAWLQLAHAVPAHSTVLSGLRALEPDIQYFGRRLAALLDGNDAAFERHSGSSTDADFKAPLSKQLLARVRDASAARHAERTQEWADRDRDRHLLVPTDKAYPSQLLALPDAPPMLAVRGQLGALNPPGIAMVGSRRGSRLGLATAGKFAHELAALGFSVVSGLAIGIDGAAHSGALDAGGITLAVSATGPDRIYPARHHLLAERIIERGAILSEFPLGDGVHRRRFPQRNRLVAALSYGVVLIEAARRSGTLTTARHATELGKPVMPVPGSIANSLNGGGHDLIRDGALLVESAADVAALVAPTLDQELIASIGTIASDNTLSPQPSLDADAARALACLEVETIDVNSLCKLCDLAPAQALAALSRLELAGLADRGRDGGYARCLS